MLSAALFRSKRFIIADIKSLCLNTLRTSPSWSRTDHLTTSLSLNIWNSTISLVLNILSSPARLAALLLVPHYLAHIHRFHIWTEHWVIFTFYSCNNINRLFVGEGRHLFTWKGTRGPFAGLHNRRTGKIFAGCSCRLFRTVPNALQDSVLYTLHLACSSALEREKTAHF